MKADDGSALTRMRDDWLKHLALTPAFVLRGTEVMRIGALGLLVGVAFGVLMVQAWMRRDGTLVLLIAPTVYVFAFHATLTHFIPRYAQPIAPIAFVVCGLLLAEAARAFHNLPTGMENPQGRSGSGLG